MSNKPWDKLNSLDQLLRRTFPVGMDADQQGIRVTIEMISGFELFNTRPYHNYETFSSGYRATLPDGWKVEREDLDDLINEITREVGRRRGLLGNDSSNTRHSD